MITSTAKIIAKALDIIGQSPRGIRYSELHRLISEGHPDIPTNTISGALHRLRSDLPEEILLPSRGLYQHKKFIELGNVPLTVDAVTSQTIKEEDFYQPFAEWLVNELEECTKAISLGGNIFRDKWGTPDVIGIREPKRSDIIKPPTEIVSAEIKIDINGLITSFGQACAYKIFSHRSYIVVPDNSSEGDISRLDALARIFGIGLILFSPADPTVPNFSIRARASRHEPDIFYVNRYLKLIEDKLFG